MRNEGEETLGGGCRRDSLHRIADRSAVQSQDSSYEISSGLLDSPMPPTSRIKGRSSESRRRGEDERKQLRKKAGS